MHFSYRKQSLKSFSLRTHVVNGRFLPGHATRINLNVACSVKLTYTLRTFNSGAHSGTNSYKLASLQGSCYTATKKTDSWRRVLSKTRRF